MSHVHEGPLASYNSLTDSHLAGYFANNRMRRHLHRAGLISKRGEIVSEATYRLSMSRKEHKKHVKDMLAQAIVHKSLDLERSRQSEIKKKLEEIAKIQLVRRVRASTNKKGDEAVLPLLTPRSGQHRSGDATKGRGRKGRQRPGCVPGVRTDSRLSLISLEEDGDVLYLDDEGRPITPADHAIDQNQIDTRHLHSLDSAALRKYAMLMAQMDEGRGLTSPYMIPQVPLPPRPPSTARTPRSARRVQSASPTRSVTTDARLARLHRPETAKSHEGDQQTMCRVTMKYHGWALNLAREKMDHTQQVIIEQQHCGGNTLTVFKDRLVPGTRFEFISYRHRGYPFSLSIYVDGQMDCRVSTCCEYRHSRGAKIGSKQGHFSLLRVGGAVPCYKCQVAKGVLVRKSAKPKKSKRPAEPRKEEVIVVATKADQRNGHEEAPETTTHVQDEEDGTEVMVAVEEEQKDADDSRIKSSRTETSYDDDFEDSQSASSKSSSSSTSSSSSESESESESEPSTPKAEEPKEADIDKKKEKKKKTEEREGKEEQFKLIEPRGKERDEEEVAVKSPTQRRGDFSGRSPRVEINGTGREIDDYSSDDEDNSKDKVIPVDEVEAENAVITSHHHSHSSLSSAASKESVDGQPKKGSSGGDALTINVELVDKEEEKEEDARKDRERRDEIRQKEEKDQQQKAQREREERKEEQRRLTEERRQADWLRHQQRDEERRKREEERQKQIERERQQREQEAEERRRQAELDNDPEVKEERRMQQYRLRQAQILEEQIQREQKRREEEETKDRKWKEDEEKREKERRKISEERERRRQEEGLSSSRTDTSTATGTSTSRTSTSSSSDTSSAESTPRRAEPESVTKEGGPRATSPLPPAARYQDERQLRASQEGAAPPRAASPLPPAAIYQDRHSWRRENQENIATASDSAARPVSPLPPPAMYEDRKKGRVRDPVPSAAVYESSIVTQQKRQEQQQQQRSEASRSAVAVVIEEPSDQHDTYRSTTTDGGTSTARSSSLTSTASVESFHVTEQKTKQPEQQQDSGTADSSSDSSPSSSDHSDTEPETPRTTNKESAESQHKVMDDGGGREGTMTHHGATSESDGENMHGGADPDRVGEEKAAAQLRPLTTRTAPKRKTHDGKVAELLSADGQSVELANILLNKSQVYELSGHLEKEEKVKMISLCNTGLDDNDLQRLTEAITASPSQPLMLNLSLNSLTTESVKHILTALKTKPSIKLLILQSNPLGDDGVKQLVNGLKDLHLQTRAAPRRSLPVDLAASDTTSLDSTASSIDRSSRFYLLQELDLADTGLTDLGAEHVARLLADNVPVEALSLGHNQGISAEKGWAPIGKALARNRSLKTLTMDGNQLGDDGVKQLAEGLQHNRILTSLTLEDTGIGAKGGASILAMLKKNTSILELTLSPGNFVPQEQAEEVAKYIALNRTPYNTLGM